nr:immunoglobulin light chain junction region [Macaca mulatta]MOX23556.1 immunoglobulin light chain junction region [Macaca mulatta]MOX23561.1 immunoglobulin light chain junction region [Macaca mulatta]MOX23610.1 immunoglobulin light chain junction region [Macaca mulatta]MOX23629.1 immunoglobulin light chain junction region [Macaca mulatta]
CMQTLDFPYSF